MKVCMVSTAPPRPCGIASYCMKLVNALCHEKKYEFTVLADKYETVCYDAPAVHGDFRIVRTWKYNTFRYPFEIFRSVLIEKPDIVHVQHEYLVFGTSAFSAIFPVVLFLLSLLHKPLIITMHSVIPRTRLSTSFFEKYGLRRGFASFGKLFVFLVTMAIGFFASKVIVHLRSAKRTLVMDYKFEPTKVVVIPHGVDICEPDLNPCDAKRKLHLDGKKIVLFFGFVTPNKGIEHLIEAMQMVVERFSDAVLLIVGNYHPHLTPNGVDYLTLLKNRVHALRLNDKIFFVSRFVPNEELHLFFSACDLVVFPYIEDDILGASGALGSLASFKKPVIATRIGRFREEIINGENGLLVSSADPVSLATAMDFLLSNTGAGKKMGLLLHNGVKDNRWENVAQKTLALYQKNWVSRLEDS